MTCALYDDATGMEYAAGTTAGTATDGPPKQLFTVDKTITAEIWFKNRNIEFNFITKWSYLMRNFALD